MKQRSLCNTFFGVSPIEKTAIFLECEHFLRTWEFENAGKTTLFTIFCDLIGRILNNVSDLIGAKTTKGKECCLNVSSRLWGGALCDDTKNGCEGDYSSAGRRAKISNTLKYLIQNSLSSGLTASFSIVKMISIVLTHQRHHHPWLKLL